MSPLPRLILIDFVTFFTKEERVIPNFSMLKARIGLVAILWG